MDFFVAVFIVAFLLYVWWLYSTRKVLKERHDWLQKQLDICSAEREALLEIITERALLSKFGKMQDDVSASAVQKRAASRMVKDPIFAKMVRLATKAEDTTQDTKWKKIWIE